MWRSRGVDSAMASEEREGSQGIIGDRGDECRTCLSDVPTRGVIGCATVLVQGLDEE